ncbi:MAG: DoxX family protein [Betaproteobacteria bacterium]|nr:MAG: DoxX family protein [Betaproteobacteria bacterium]
MQNLGPVPHPPVGPAAVVWRAASRFAPAISGLNRLAPFVDLGVRLFVASVFFKSGLTKIVNWDSTVALFDNEYAVPLLPPEIAALLGSGVELIFPVLLVLGLGARVSALVLFAFNIIAVISYPDLSAAGLKDHQTWGLLLLITLLHGPGKLSFDHLIGRRLLAR